MENLEALKKDRIKVILSRYAQSLSYFIPLIVDILYLSKISPKGIGGVGVILPIIYFVAVLERNFSRGATLLGTRENHDSANPSAHLKSIIISNFIFVITLSLIVNISIIPLSFVLNSMIWHLSGDAKSILIYYLWWLLPRLLLTGSITTATSFFNINLKPIYVTKSLITASVVKVVLNTIFMLTLVTDPISAAKFLALSTGISSLIQVLMLLYFIKRDYSYFFKNINLSFASFVENVKKQVAFGLPFIMEEIAVLLANNVMIATITRYGSEAIAGYTFVQNLTMLCTAWGSAAGYWSQSFMSLSIDKHNATVYKSNILFYKKHLYNSIIISITLSALLLTLYLLLLRSYLGHDQAITQVILIFLCLDPILQFGRLLNLSFVPMLVLMAKKRFVAITSSVVNYFYYIPLLFIMPLYFKTFGVALIAILMISDELIRTGLNALQIKKSIHII